MIFQSPFTLIISIALERCEDENREIWIASHLASDSNRLTIGFNLFAIFRLTKFGLEVEFLLGQEESETLISSLVSSVSFSFSRDLLFAGR